jgi:hypothetical protein
MGSRNRTKKPKYYSTTKSANQVANKLCGIIADYGAKQYSVEMEEIDGKRIPKAISFWMEVPNIDSDVPVRLEPQTKNIKERMDCDEDHARAVAWKQLKDQIEITLELVQNGVKEFHEAFLPNIQVFGPDNTVQDMSERVLDQLSDDNLPGLPS